MNIADEHLWCTIFQFWLRYKLMNSFDGHCWWPCGWTLLMNTLTLNFKILLKNTLIFGWDICKRTLLMNIADEHSWWTCFMYSFLINIGLEELEFQVWLIGVQFWLRYKLINSFDGHCWWTCWWTWLMNTFSLSISF